VLGSKRFQEIEEAYPMALLAASLNALKRDGELDFDDIDLLSRMVDAMICKIAPMLPEADHPKKLRERGQKIIASLLGAYRRK
jgi:hypothetical protein